MDCCSVNAEESERQGAEADSEPKRAPSAVSSWKRASALIAAVGVALLPKCPACWSVYAGLSSWLGMSFALEPRRALPLTLGSLALALLSLAVVARRSGRHAPLVLGTASALGVWAGKFVLNLEPLTYLSLCGLIIASLAARQLGPRRARSPRGAHSRPLQRSELSENAEAR